MAAPPKDEPLLNLDEIQGNVIPGFLKDHQHFIFFSITDPAAARTCLRKLYSRLSTAAEVLEAHAARKRMLARSGKEPDAAPFLFFNVALSATGCRKLTSSAEVNDFSDEAFKIGLTLERSQYVGDPGLKSEAGHASNWIVGGPSHPVDGVLIAASDDLPRLLDQVKKITEEFVAQGMSIVHEDRGDADATGQHGHEHFGFKDGISHPSVRGRRPEEPYDFVYPRTFPADKAFDAVRADFAQPGSRHVWPGHFVFGYGRQKGDDPRTYDATDQARGPAWAKEGSFLVYRRLRQNTAEFTRYVEVTARELKKKYTKSAPDKERLAAMLVGRWPSGTPIVRSPDKDIGVVDDAANYFGYANKATPALPRDTAPQIADPDGLLCPLAAHIRKVNPRDQATDLGFSERTPPRSLLRRGITYAAGKDDKGLLFVAYQSSIEEQFEFLMRQWINKPNRPRDRGGHDPILSQTSKRVFYLRIDDTVEELSIPNAFVVPTGGEYLFAPSVSFFRDRLSSSAKK